ncbi:hypothetical protein [Streptomyces spirodelae]|uniref:Uncharacterized protein n=1 Tax=Streptomyces spirodelae TaxID=2812904 RepID=A0ABS3WWQ0_9ACTN|nr:hypothetical protein [Streptomyces spirodelae]MBO8187557.1 hypothetical protein [Streptomyces spirodelae]
MGALTLDPNSKTWLAEYYRCQTRARDLLKVCAARDIPLAAEDRARITSCDDSEQLDEWFDNAMQANTADEVFAEPSAAPQ